MSKMSELHFIIHDLLEQGATNQEIVRIVNEDIGPIDRSFVETMIQVAVEEMESYDGEV
jgi:hypothetical protein